ncbi:MAG: hypothetical protein MUP53_05480, partial [Bacteroidales bacterium]|nr:hypothetical protein [Bacteroidales bacterium]
MDLTYRQILKWGDKREPQIDPLMLKVIREKFGLEESDFGTKHLPGGQEVRLVKASSLTPPQLDFFRDIVGEENLHSDDFTRAKFAYGKFYGELLDLRMNLVPHPP